MAGRLIQGVWTSKKTWEHAEDGEFRRQASAFRERVAPGGRFDVEAGRYHLFVSHACPWAHRTLIVRALLGLEDAIGVSVVHPHMTDEGWHFDADDPTYPTPNHILGERYLRDVYLRADDTFTGRVTVPVLWDTREGTIVNNESREIIEMFATVFAPLWTRTRDLYPEAARAELNVHIDRMYPSINNGVYRCGFAGSQAAYERAFSELFEALDHFDTVLADRRFLGGDALTLADVCLFPTLLRFDPVYVTHFKTNLRRIADYPNLWGYVRDVYAQTLIAETCHLDHIKDHYFLSHPQLNPRGIVPVGPAVDFSEPTDRGARFG